MTGYFEAVAWRLERRRSVQRDTQIRRWPASGAVVGYVQGATMYCYDCVGGIVPVCITNCPVSASLLKFTDFMLSILPVIKSRSSFQSNDRRSSYSSLFLIYSCKARVWFHSSCHASSVGHGKSLELLVDGMIRKNTGSRWISDREKYMSEYASTRT